MTAETPPTQGTPFPPGVSMLVKVDEAVVVNVYALAAIEQSEGGKAVLVLHSGRRITCPISTFSEVWTELGRASNLRVVRG